MLAHEPVNNLSTGPALHHADERQDQDRDHGQSQNQHRQLPVEESVQREVKARKGYPCSMCAQVFYRSEHRARHQRGHTREKPFPCEHCGRYFARKDLVKRHERSFHPFESAKRAEAKASATETPSDAVADACATLNRDSSGGGLELASTRSNQEIRTSSSGPSEPSTHRSLTDLTAEALTGHGGILPPQIVRQDNEQNIPRDPSPRPDPEATGHETAHNEPLSTPGHNGQLLLPAVQDQSVPAFSQYFVNTQLSNNSSWQTQNALHEQVFPTLESHSANVLPSESPVENYQNDPYFTSTLGTQASSMEFDLSISNILFGTASNVLINHDIANGWEGSDFTSSASSVSAGKNSSGSPPDTGNRRSTIKDSPINMRHLPKITEERPRAIHAPLIDENVYALMLVDIQKRLPFENIGDWQLPNRQHLNSFLKGYLYCFHSHFPIVHLPHLDLAGTPAPYILSMCAIGAQYRLNRKAAKSLWLYANKLADAEVRSLPPRNLQLHPLWLAQYKLLLAFYAVLSGDVVDTATALDNITYWTTEFRLRRAKLNSSPLPTSVSSWMDWSLREASKRLLYGIFILSNLITVTYGMAPTFSLTQDLDLELPEAESLWEATTEEQWLEMRSGQQAFNSMTIREALNHLLGRELPFNGCNEGKTWSGLATLVVMYAVNIHMWSIAESTQSLTTFAWTGQEGTENRIPLLTQVATDLTRCYALLTADRSELERSSDDKEGPLLFNCLALLRIAYLRLFAGVNGLDRTVLFSGNEEHISTSIRMYVTCPQERRPFLTQTIVKAYEGMISIFQPGYLVVRKVAALSWSVEHAISAWDSALFVTKWIHTMQKQQQQHDNPLTNEEVGYFTNFRDLMGELHPEFEMGESLAADITKTWAVCFDDTWVWGVTFRIGHILRLLSAAYDEDWKSSSSQAHETQKNTP